MEITPWKESKARVDAMSLTEKLCRRRDTDLNSKTGKMSLDVSESGYTAIKALTELTGMSLSELVSSLCKSARLTIVFDSSVEKKLGELRSLRQSVHETLLRTMMSDNPEENIQIRDELMIKQDNVRWSGGINPSGLAEFWIYDHSGPRCLTGYPMGAVGHMELWPKITVDRKYANSLLRFNSPYVSETNLPMPVEFKDILESYAIAENEFTESLRLGVDYTVSLR